MVEVGTLAPTGAAIGLPVLADFKYGEQSHNGGMKE